MTQQQPPENPGKPIITPAPPKKHYCFDRLIWCPDMQYYECGKCGLAYKEAELHKICADRIAELEAALEKLRHYADHDPSCMLRGTWGKYRGAECKQCGREYMDTQKSSCPHDTHECSCGLDALKGEE